MTTLHLAELKLSPTTMHGCSKEQKQINVNEAMVLVSSSDVGSLAPMVTLAKLLVNHGFSSHLVIYDHPFRPSQELVSRLSSDPANSTLSFHLIPPISLGDNHSTHDQPLVMDATRNAQTKNLQYFMTDLLKTSSVRAIIIDLYCMVALHVAKQFGIPGYIFTAFNASTTVFFLSILELDTSSNLSLKDFGVNPISFSGLPPLPASELPIWLSDRESGWYKYLVPKLSNVVNLSDGIIMNTFDSIEPKAISALREGICVPSFNMPQIYSIGPLLTESEVNETAEWHECLKWLDSQPKGTVVFLCFGSRGGFVPDQIKQIAIGLENSGQRFLWVVKAVNVTNKISGNGTNEFELAQVLPKGFFNRTKDRGMVVKTWIPQIQVLRHEAIGGFVTHCGWNSILEAVTSGKPMICWPLYSEQRLNKAILEDHEMRLGVAIEGCDHDMVVAEEVEAKVRWLMEAEGGKLLKERAEAMKVNAEESLSEAGSSSKAFMQFLMDLKRQKLLETKI